MFFQETYLFSFFTLCLFFRQHTKNGAGYKPRPVSRHSDFPGTAGVGMQHFLCGGEGGFSLVYFQQLPRGGAIAG